jgi:hypothetical protein
MEADCLRGATPLFWSKGKTVEACLFFNPVEFDGVKVWVVKLLPYSQEFQGITIAQSVPN